MVTVPDGVGSQMLGICTSKTVDRSCARHCPLPSWHWPRLQPIRRCQDMAIANALVFIDHCPSQGYFHWQALMADAVHGLGDTAAEVAWELSLRLGVPHTWRVAWTSPHCLILPLFYGYISSCWSASCEVGAMHDTTFWVLSRWQLWRMLKLHDHQTRRVHDAGYPAMFRKIASRLTWTPWVVMIELLIFRSTPGDMGKSNPLVLLLSLRCISSMTVWKGGQCLVCRLVWEFMPMACGTDW